MEVKKGYIVRCHLSSFFAEKFGVKGSKKAEVLHVTKNRVKIFRNGEEISVPPDAIVHICKKETQQKTTEMLTKHFTA